MAGYSQCVVGGLALPTICQKRQSQPITVGFE
ncbi:hypothetical protein VC_1648 [Vibrio cholerae O1 biovar El Tor str. N16961]|uniref:Uncharacterized protein n=2 Tax=Vibrio cholerae TaxID=666 RepID=Q9KRJ2_VIBCH|nr:hypothetical protein VC_1648 [Vibrio cholerae O1 biovar El Tor str. N16961]ACP05900.1 conserved hypothetical protein [Vibrio cholerae M66-2]ACP09766.1 conserved hypothetical protein [Vibrio cholerae O395]